MERLFSINEAAKALGGVSPLTIAGWCARGRLARTKVGRRTMISESELQRFIEAGNSEPQPVMSSIAEVSQ
jgi:excisionase family DNA binding protein